MATRRKKKRASARARPDPAAVELQALIQAVMDARGAAAREAAINALTEFRTRPVSPELREIAAEARAAASTQDIDESLAQLRGIAARMRAAIPGLEAGTAIAAQGSQKLLFPRLAKAAQAMLETVQELKAELDTLKAGLDDVEDLEDLPQLLETLGAQLDKLKARAEALKKP